MDFIMQFCLTCDVTNISLTCLPPLCYTNSVVVEPLIDSIKLPHIKPIQVTCGGLDAFVEDVFQDTLIFHILIQSKL